tara:strand:- start:61 stop:1938 length:1878 start_codon:yes stop_codon:yes gene_type:complete
MGYIGLDINYGDVNSQTGTGDGSDTTPIATLDYSVPTSSSIVVTLDGVTQVPDTDYTVTSGTTLTFTTAPANLVKILVVFLGRSLGLGTPADGTVTNSTTNFQPGTVFKGDGASTDGKITLNCSQNTHGVSIQSPNHASTASYTLTLPTTNGNANELLKTDGNGVLSWTPDIDTTNTNASNLVSGTLPDARFPATLPVASGANLTALPAGNLTGALPAISGANLTGVDADLTPAHQGIANLGLIMATEHDKVAFNLTGSFIDIFQDSSGVTTTTDVSVNASEYVSSISTAVTAFTADSNTKALLHMDDTGLTDSSSTGHTTSLVGNTTRSGTQSKYGSYSAYFDGSGDVLKLPVHSDFVFGQGAWTIEGYFYFTALGSQRAIYSSSTSHTTGWNYPSSTGAFAIHINSAGAVTIDTEEGANHAGSAGAITINTWKHVALTHASGSSDVKVWIDGSLNSTIATGANRYYGMTGGQPGFGAYDFYSSSYRYPYVGFMDELRISNVERYTTTFTPNSNTVTSATGTLISDAQTVASTSEVSGVFTYTDSAGTNTIGTDLKIYFTANNGTNWTEAASYGTATTFSGSIKQVKMGKTTVTAGTQVAIKAVWANQVASSKVAHLNGWAVNY